MKELKLEILKTKDGYEIQDLTNLSLYYFSDDEYGRQQLVQFLADNLLNAQITDGTLYIVEQ